MRIRKDAAQKPKGSAMPQVTGILETAFHVDDIRRPFSECSVFLCPIFAGAGVRVKILEAFASGIPVVATPLGAEGLDAAHGRELLLAGSAEEFAAATLDLFDNPERAQQIARNARRAVEEKWDWQVVLPRLEEAYYAALRRCRGESSRFQVPGSRLEEPQTLHSEP